MTKNIQINLIDDAICAEKQPLKKKGYVCSWHKWVREEDLILVITKTGKEYLRCFHCERRKQENKQINHQEWLRHKEDISDYYVRWILSKEGKGKKLKMYEYPQSLVDAKRAVIQLKRLKKKMEEPLKKCVHHGDLYQEDVIKSGKKKNGDQIYKCKHCMADFHKSHYELNKIKVKMAQAVYRENNKEKYLEIKRKSFKKHGHKYLEKNNERRKLFDRKATPELGDRYIKKLLVKNTNLSWKDLPPSLIECKKVLMQFKRKIKSKLEENKLNLLEEKLNVKNSTKD
jgi:hypothetical protein